MRKKPRCRIVGFSKEDAYYYLDKNRLVGAIGHFAVEHTLSEILHSKYTSGTFYVDFKPNGKQSREACYFYAVKVEPVEA